MPIERILITVKTYPAVSSTYDELVCTAGLRPDGSWVRIFPVQYRQIEDYEKKYKKWDWIDIDLKKNTADSRPETFRPLNQDSINIIKSLGTEQNWYERKQLILENGSVYYDLDEIISQNKRGVLSLATFKPTEITKFEIEEDDREWDSDKLEVIKLKAKQGDLFSESPNIFKVVNKLPYKFFYCFKDSKGKSSRLMIEDWEIGALYWNCLRKHKSEEIAINKVKQKYFDEFTKNKDLYFFLGTTKLWDKRAPNPFLIIGVFFPPIEKQSSLF